MALHSTWMQIVVQPRLERHDAKGIRWGDTWSLALRMASQFYAYTPHNAKICKNTNLVMISVEGVLVRIGLHLLHDFTCVNGNEVTAVIWVAGLTCMWPWTIGEEWCASLQTKDVETQIGSPPTVMNHLKVIFPLRDISTAGLPQLTPRTDQCKASRSSSCWEAFGRAKLRKRRNQGNRLAKGMIESGVGTQERFQTCRRNSLVMWKWWNSCHICNNSEIAIYYVRETKGNETWSAVTRLIIMVKYMDIELYAATE